MKIPFILGKVATEESFTDREQELAYFVQYFISLFRKRKGNRVVLRDDKFCICYIDLFEACNEEHFYSLLVRKVILATSSEWEEIINAGRFFLYLSPRISIDKTTNRISIDFFDRKMVERYPDEVLNLAERIAIAKGQDIVVYIEGFDRINEFSDSASFRKRLCAYWQRHQHVVYCVFDSDHPLL